MSGLVDIGANLTSKRFAADIDAVLRRARGNGVGTIVVTGTSVEASRAALELARRYPGELYCTAGVHPHEASTFSSCSLEQLRQLSRAVPVCAIGETGLDFNRDFSPRPAQESAFRAQIELACETGLPLFLHERDALSRQLALLGPYHGRYSRAVAHCFTGDRTMLREYLALDCYIGITGWLCDPRRGQDLQQAVGDIPRDRLLIETDAPYLLPRVAAAQLDLAVSGRNEPCTLPLVLAELARLREEPVAELAAQTRANSERFFGFGRPADRPLSSPPTGA